MIMWRFYICIKYSYTYTNPVYTIFFVHNLNVESLSSLSLLVYKKYPIHTQCAGRLFPCQTSRLHRMAHRVSSSTENWRKYCTAAMLWSYILQTKLKTVGTAQSVWCLGYELLRTGFICCQDKGFFSSPKRPDWLWDTPSFLFNWCRKLFHRE
jgi:hypothetical protein